MGLKLCLLLNERIGSQIEDIWRQSAAEKVWK
jgi:hypothetical protein